MADAVEKPPAWSTSVPQLPPRAGRRSGEAAHRGGLPWLGVPLARPVSAGLDRGPLLPLVWRLQKSEAAAGLWAISEPISSTSPTISAGSRS